MGTKWPVPQLRLFCWRTAWNLGPSSASSHTSQAPKGQGLRTSALVSHYRERGAGEGKCSSEPGGVPKALSGGSRSDRSA